MYWAVLCVHGTMLTRGTARGLLHQADMVMYTLMCHHSCPQTASVFLRAGCQAKTRRCHMDIYISPGKCRWLSPIRAQPGGQQGMALVLAGPVGTHWEFSAQPRLGYLGSACLISAFQNNTDDDGVECPMPR